jgi:hypothetical protein|tara:strand:+ start:425 stop:703 length:279 start_codon:yes stop_codon:yes gene_type:complete
MSKSQDRRIAIQKETKVMSETKKEDWQRLEITDVIDNPDGTSTLVFELEDEFKEWFKKSFGLKRWSDKRFEKVLIESLDLYLKKLKLNEDIK